MCLAPRWYSASTTLSYSACPARRRDLNLHISDDDVDLAAIKEERFRDALGPAFIRAYLGDSTTRPAYRAEAVNLVGRILNHFFMERS